MRWYFVLLIIAVAFLIFMIVAGTHLFFSFAIVSENRKRKKKTTAWDEDENHPEDVLFNPNCIPYRDVLIEGRKWVKSQRLDEYEVTSFDGLKLKAKFLPAENMRGIVLMMHGFHSSALHDFSLAIKEYHDRGFGCFLPYQRAHGDSEGKYIYYGTKERYDVQSWCRLIDREFSGLPIILDGISMGATTVMMASSLDLPESVSGIVADCGFTSPYEEFRFVLKERYKIGVFPFLYTMWLDAKCRAGFIMKSVSTLDELNKNRRPILIAHGECDTLVPHAMSVRNYAVAKEVCDAVFLSVPHAEHGLSFLIEKDRYLKEIDKFLCKCIKQQRE